MAQPPGRPTPSRYQIRIGAHLDVHWSGWFDDLTLVQEVDGTTTLTGLIQDQAQLHGLLARIRDLSVTLISVEVLDATGPNERSQG